MNRDYRFVKIDINNSELRCQGYNPLSYCWVNFVIMNIPPQKGTVSRVALKIFSIASVAPESIGRFLIFFSNPNFYTYKSITKILS